MRLTTVPQPAVEPGILPTGSPAPAAQRHRPYLHARLTGRGRLVHTEHLPGWCCISRSGSFFTNRCRLHNDRWHSGWSAAGPDTLVAARVALLQSARDSAYRLEEVVSRSLVLGSRGLHPDAEEDRQQGQERRTDEYPCRPRQWIRGNASAVTIPPPKNGSKSRCLRP